VVTTCFRVCDTIAKLLSRRLSKAISKTEAGFNTDIVVKELLDLLVSKRILNKREVDKLLQSAKPISMKSQSLLGGIWGKNNVDGKGATFSFSLPTVTRY
jgi:hypothetical protein